MNDQYNLQALQQIELEILLELDRICKKHDIHYWLDAGTLLGAVRHGGFIPWDDDIDVGMLRPDFEKFMEIAPKELGTDYFLQSRETDPNYPFSFPKIRKNHTTFIEWALKSIDMHHGIYIDIFVYDVLPEENTSEFIEEAIELDKQLIRKLVLDVDMKPEWSARYIKTWLKKKIAHLLYAGKSAETIDQQIEETFSRYQEEQYPNRKITCLSFRKEYLFYEDDVMPTKMWTFEEYEFPVPGHMDAYLKALYGDYMQLPPVKERRGHRPAFVHLSKQLNPNDVL